MAYLRHPDSDDDSIGEAMIRNVSGSMLPNRELLQSRGEPIEVIREAFTSHLVVPDVIDRPPLSKLNLRYLNGTYVTTGSLQSAENVFNVPELDFSQLDPSKFYTMIMTDPDVPNRAMPIEREYLHWLIVNIHENDIEKGLELVPYSPPLPPLGAGLHRYVFLVLEQTIPILFSSSPTPPKTESLTDGRTDEYSRSKSPVPGYQKEKVELKSGRQMESNKAESKNQRYDDRGPKSMLNDDRATNKAMNKSAQNSARNDDFSSPKIKGNGETDQLSPYSDNKFRLSPTPPPQYSRRESMPNIERKKFSTKDFIKKHTIQSIVAGNFFQTEFDEFVRQVSSPPKPEEDSRENKSEKKPHPRTPSFIPKKVAEVSEEIKTLKISKL